MPDNGEPILHVDHLAAGYGDIKAITDISLRAWSGKVTAVLGANGAGKTTLVSTIAGLIRVQSGTITMRGEDIGRLRPSARMLRGIALVQEGKRIFHRRTVHENLLLGGYRMSRSARSGAVEAAYESFPILREKRNSVAGSLSGGQQQMLAIAQALMPAPQVLMLDEPSAGLAPIIVDELLKTIRKLKSDGMAVILVEQLVDKALAVSDHVVAIQQGRVVSDQPAASVTTAILHDAYLGARNSPARTTGE
jgi:branched-chain amino acid transport system ATP-binding protein